MSDSEEKKGTKEMLLAKIYSQLREIEYLIRKIEGQSGDRRGDSRSMQLMDEEEYPEYG
jgi:hypothetical protein